MGRVPVCGLAAAGQEGVVRTFEIIEDEMNSALGLLGAPTLADLDASFVAPAPPVGEPSVTSSPSGSTTSSASTWLVVVPYLSVWGPPEFSATLPPIVQAS